MPTPIQVSALLRPTGASPGIGSSGTSSQAATIGEHARAAGDRQHDEPDAEDDRVDVEVAPEATGDAAEDAVGRGAREAAGSPGRRAGGGRRGRLLLRALRTGLERVAGGHGLGRPGHGLVGSGSGRAAWGEWTFGAVPLGRGADAQQLTHERLRAYRESPLAVP